MARTLRSVVATSKRLSPTARRRFLTLCLFLSALLFYTFTLAPTVTWADGARLQTEAITGSSSYLLFEETSQAATDGLPLDRLGVAAWDHPLYIMLGQLFRALPWGEAPYRINLMSALAAAATIALVFRIGLWMTNDAAASTFGAIVLAISHTFWFHAVLAEVYALHSLFMVSLIGLALRWSHHRRPRDMMLFALVAGLGLATHLMLAPTVLIVVLFMAITAMSQSGRGQLRAAHSPWQPLNSKGAWTRRVIVCAGLFLAGFSPWWIQFLRMTRLIGAPLTLKLATGYPWVPGSFAIPSVEAGFYNLLIYAGWLIYQFTPFGVAFGVYGFLSLVRVRRRSALFLIALFLVHAALSANYTAPDRFALHLPSYVVFALFVAPGISRLKRAMHTSLSGHAWLTFGWRASLLMACLAPMVIYAITPQALPIMGFTDERLGIRPIGAGARDTLRYFLDPNKRGDYSAERFGRSTMSRLAPNALVFTPRHSDGEVYFVLRYFQLVESLRPDIHLELMLFDGKNTVSEAILDLVHSQMSCRPIYFASLDAHTYPIDSLHSHFYFVPEANLFRLMAYRPLRHESACPDLHLRWAGVPLSQLVANVLQQWP